MELGIFSRTYQLIGIDKICAQAAQDGFQTIQFNFSSAGLPSLPKDWPETTIKEVMASATQSGLTICALSGTYNMAHPDVARRQVGPDRLHERRASRAIHAGTPCDPLHRISRCNEHVVASPGQWIS